MYFKEHFYFKLLTYSAPIILYAVTFLILMLLICSVYHSVLVHLQKMVSGVHKYISENVCFHEKKLLRNKNFSFQNCTMESYAYLVVRFKS